MRIYEHEAKELLSNAQVKTPSRQLTGSLKEVVEIAEELTYPVALKAQTLLKARAKAGLILFADNPSEAISCAENLFEKRHAGERIRSVLVEKKVQIDRELYLGIIADYSACKPVIVASPLGGTDIEKIAQDQPQFILKEPLDSFNHVGTEQISRIANFLGQGIDRSHVTQEKLRKVVRGSIDVFLANDCEMLEINPLVITKAGDVVAVDGTAAIDEDSLYRQSHLVKPRGQSKEEFERAQDFRARGWSYLKFSGEIGLLSSGAGITMVIMDLLRGQGVEPANFLDTAQMDRQGIYDAFQIFLDDPKIKTVLVNIFAGLNRCDHLAEGILDFLKNHRPHFEIVVRMAGNREEEGHEILRSVGITAIKSLEDAVSKAIKTNRR